MLYWIFLIPAAFLILLIVMLVRQRKANKLHQDAMNSLESEFWSRQSRLQTIVFLVRQGHRIPQNEQVVEVTENGLITRDKFTGKTIITQPRETKK